MTRLAILSDIHGNLPALEAVLQDVATHNVDQIIVAGDNINWGPFSKAVLQRLFDIGAVVMRGNHEFYMLNIDTPRMPERWREFLMPRALVQDLPDALIQKIACLPDELSLNFRDAPPLRVVHARPGSPWEGFYSTDTDIEVRQKLGDVTEKTVIAGHTHLRFDREVDGVRVLNPGAVGLMFDRNADASYLLLNGDESGWRPTFRRVPYDQSALMSGYEMMGYNHRMPEEIYLMKQDFVTAFPNVYAFHVWKSQTHPDQPRTMTMLEDYMAIADKDPFVKPAYRLEYLETFD